MDAHSFLPIGQRVSKTYIQTLCKLIVKICFPCGCSEALAVKVCFNLISTVHNEENKK